MIVVNVPGQLQRRLKLSSWENTQELKAHPALVWRMDQINIGLKRCNLLCMNEHTGYTMLLVDVKPLNELNALQGLVKRLKSELGRHHFHPAVMRQIENGRLIAGKSSDRKVIGNFNALKQYYEDCFYNNDHPMIAESACQRIPMFGFEEVIPERGFAKLARRDDPVSE